MAEYNIKDTLETMSEYMGSQLHRQLDLKEEEFRVDELPAPSASIKGEIYQYMGDSTVDYQHSYFYECVALGTSPETYGWLAVNVQPSESGQTIQYDTMPEAGSDNEDIIVQYVGDTTQTYTNGFFYKCVAQGTDPETYEWEAQPVQEGGDGGDKEDKFRYSTMPEVSAENHGKIYQYIGQTNANFTEGYSYKSDYFYKEYIGNVSDFECSGSSRNYVISTDSITMQTVQNEAQETIVKCIVPMVNKGTLKITKTRVIGDRLNYIYTELGTTSGANDLYTSSNWSSIAVGSTVVEEIDLSQYNASEIYLSFHMIVNSGNNSVFEISSIEQSYRQWLEEEVSRQPQQFTSAEMTEIKNAVSQETANVKVVPYHIYSPNERQVGEWQEVRDGVLKKKPLYEKTLSCGTMPNSTTKQVDIGVSNLDRIFAIEGQTVHKTDHYSIPLPNVNVSDSKWQIQIYYSADNEKLQIIVRGDWTDYDAYVTLRYTKTTDSWENV